MDLATNLRASKLRAEIMKPGGIGEAMLELLQRPDLDAADTMLAMRVRHRLRRNGNAKCITQAVEEKRRLICSLFADVFDATAGRITVYAIPNDADDQVWIRDGMHRTSSLLMLGRPVPAVLIELKKGNGR